MPPMNQIVVQTILLPPDRRDENVLRQAKNLLTKSLMMVNDNLARLSFTIINDFVSKFFACLKTFSSLRSGGSKIVCTTI